MPYPENGPNEPLEYPHDLGGAEPAFGVPPADGPPRLPVSYPGLPRRRADTGIDVPNGC